MERKDKTYVIYRIISPRGKQYVGYTSIGLKNRWRSHRWRAKRGEAPNHPFYNEIRMYPESDFKIEEITQTNDKQEAMRLERKYIAEVPKEYSMNLSTGAPNDAREGGLIFWKRLNEDPSKREAYLKKLSETKKANDWSDYEKLSEQGAKWRKEHPREAYKLTYRAIRIANRKNGNPSPSHQSEDTRPLKERLLHKYKLNDIRRQNATEAWKNYSDEKRANISRKISESQKLANRRKPREEITASCANARSHIDRRKQSAAASQGLKNWWTELKSDPERYEKYIKNRTASLEKTIKKKVAK